MQTVPYADPRAPFHRKQAFDFGDGGLGHAVNNLALGCDCLGVIKVIRPLDSFKGSNGRNRNLTG